MRRTEALGDGDVGGSRRLAAAALLLILGAVALYWTPIIQGDFILDDRLFLEQDARLSDPGERGRIWTTSLFDRESIGRSWADPALLAAYYRPLVLLSLYTSHDLLGPSPGHFHLENVLAHGLLAGLLLLWLARRGAPRAGLMAGLLFLGHPVGPEVVGWIAGRSDLFAVLLVLTSLALLEPCAGGKGEGVRDVAACLAYLGACLSKETAVLLGLLLPFATWLQEGRTGRGARVLLPVWGLYLALRVNALGVLQSAGGRTLEFSPLVQASWLWRWLQHLLAPYDLKLLFYPPGTGDWSFGSLDVQALLLLVVVALLWGVAARSGKDRPALAATRWIGLGMILLSLLPVLGWIPLAYPFSDRYLYASVAGFCMIIGGVSGALREPTRRRVSFAMLLLFMIQASVLVRRNEAFTSTARFLAVALSGSVHQERAYHFLAEEQLYQGRPEAAVRVLTAGLAHHPESGRLRLTRGVALRRTGRDADALASFRQVPESSPWYPAALCHQAYIHRLAGREGEAWKLVERGLARVPGHPGLLALRGELHLSAGSLVEARSDLEAALRAQPLEALTHFNLGLVLRQQGELGAAIEAVHRAHRLNRRDPRMAGALGQLILEAGQEQEGRRWLLEAQRLEQARGDAGQPRRGPGPTLPGVAPAP